jgi:hypothetical protein
LGLSQALNQAIIDQSGTSPLPDFLTEPLNQRNEVAKRLARRLGLTLPQGHPPQVPEIAIEAALPPSQESQALKKSSLRHRGDESSHPPARESDQKK